MWHAKLATETLRLDVNARKKLEKDLREISGDCKLESRREGTDWKIIYWQLLEIDDLFPGMTQAGGAVSMPNTETKNVNNEPPSLKLKSPFSKENKWSHYHKEVKV